MNDIEVDLFYYRDLLQREREKPLHDIQSYFNLITSGTTFSFARLSNNDKTAALLNELKRYGFVANDTNLAYFRVLFGIPLYKEDVPYKPIMWKKNGQLLRYFIQYLFSSEMMWFYAKILVPLMFVNKRYTPINLAKSDIKRLENSSDYCRLKAILENFNT